MGFDSRKCTIKIVYCGNSNDFDRNKYTRKGTAHECLKQGIGAGTSTERKKHIPRTSLQNIKYVGPIYEQNFKNNGVSSLSQLEWLFGRLSKSEQKKFLKKVSKNADGHTDYRVYNSVLLYLYNKNINGLTSCRTR